jgi:hypothetical protein
MGNKYKEYGGGPATGLADDFVKFLMRGLNTGSFGGASGMQRFNGSNPDGSSQGMAGILNDILSGGAGQLGGSMQQMISRDTDRQVGALRSRYGVGGGTAFGTGAQYAEGTLRAEQAPRLASAVGQLQLQTLLPLLQMTGQIAQMGIPQRQGVMQPNPWVSAIGAAAPIIGAALPMMGGMFGGGAPNLSIPNLQLPNIGLPPLPPPPGLY